MGLDLGTISASVGLNTSPLAAGTVKAKAMFSGLDKSLGGGLKGSEKGIAGLGNSLKNLGGTATKSLGALGSQLGSLGALGTIGLVAGAVVGLGAGLLSCAKDAMEAQVVMAETNAILKTTGAVSNVTADGLEALSLKIAEKTGYDDEAVQSAGNMLLTFPKVRNEVGKSNDIFNQALDLSADMARKFGTEIPAAAKLLGKALGEPVRGVTALQRMGVMLSDSQKKQVQSFVDSGNVMAAQKVILEEVRSEVGLVAEAYGSTLAGKIDIAKMEFGNLKEEIGGKTLPVFARVLKAVNDIAKTKFPDKFAPKIEITTNAGQAVKEAAKALAAFDKGIAKGGLLSVLAKVDTTEVKKAKEEIDNLGKDVPDIILRFRDVGLAGTTSKDIQGMIKMMADYEPAMRESGVKMFKGIMDAEAYSHPKIAAGMDKITSSMTDKIMGMSTGQLTQAKLNEIVQEEIKANPECAAEMTLIMQTLNQIIAGTPITPPNIPAPTATDPTPTAQGVTTSLNNWFGGNPSSPVISGVDNRINYASIAAGVTGALQSALYSNPAHPVISSIAIKLSPIRIFSSAAAAGEYIAQELTGGINAGMSSNPAGITLSGGASGGSAMSDLASATDLVNASFGNFIKDMTAEPLNEVNNAIMRLTANNTSSLGDWWKLRGAYDAATASLASYEKQIKSGEAAITSLEGKIEKANAARERPSMVMDKASSELQLRIMKAEDVHNYALAAKLTLEKDALDRKKEELDLTTSIADKTKDLKDTSAFAGKTTAQIDAMIATWSAALLKKTSQVAALKVTYEKVQVSVDKFKKIIDDLAAYFTSKSPAPAGYAGGTNYVPRTGMALVHQGEQIIPANLNPLTLGSGSSTLITVPLYLDGKVIAKSVSRYQGGQANSRAMSGGRY